MTFVQRIRESCQRIRFKYTTLREFFVNKRDLERELLAPPYKQNIIAWRMPVAFLIMVVGQVSGFHWTENALELVLVSISANLPHHIAPRICFSQPKRLQFRSLIRACNAWKRMLWTLRRYVSSQKNPTISFVHVITEQDAQPLEMAPGILGI